ncbi:ankyrin repeat domain-containing protein [Criblamydia sequanensis]|uniref:Uncharacterized protein n=1 Tax=Candidatus Criblamydia sequanensis CRIB-18 TaxID=1437425 RepID=A0A090CYP1_9BACT|nr:ankyrin repeat domain-containing protein [Criblamydia sequanensis]CDR33646.1 hypothetical protein CSEC_0817 [Criblamydia sequanensis CRIB-18]
MGLGISPASELIYTLSDNFPRMVTEENLAMLELLLANGADPNLRDVEGKTPLQLPQKWVIELIQNLFWR